jgi:putative peptidoglycan lipid II flippase
MGQRSKMSNITGAAFVMSGATFLSRIAGFLRDMIIARILGASGMSDAYFVAFRIPSLLRELFAEGSMSSGFIPVLTEYRTKRGDEEVKRLVMVTFAFIAVAIGAACVLGIVFSPQLVVLMAPGFAGNPEKIRITVMLTRIMFPFLLFTSLSALAMGALNTRRVFFVPALASAWFNVANIAVMLIFFKYFKEPVTVVALGVTVGGVVQFASQLPAFFRQGYSLRPDFNFRHPGLKKIGLLVLPTTAGVAVSQLNVFIGTVLASYLAVGSVTYLYYAMRLIQFPVGIFGVAIGMAALPALSEHAAKGDMESLKNDFSFSLRLLFAVTVPSMAGLLALGKPIVNLLFQHGAFDLPATLGTERALMFYCLGIWAVVGVRILAATFYSMMDTRTPVKTAAVALTANVFLSVMLMDSMSYAGLALASAASSSLNFTMLFYSLRKRLKGVGAGAIILSFIKTLAASAVMGAVGWYIINLRGWETSGGVLVKSLILFPTIALCAAVYFIVAVLLKSEEALYIIGAIKRKMRIK